METFDFSSPKQLVFGPDRIGLLPALCAAFGSRLILVTGKSSFLNSEEWAVLEKGFKQKKMAVHPVSIAGEPSPEDIDPVVRQFSRDPMDLVVAIGGGSVIDGGKAISAMMGLDDSVAAYLEGVGTRAHPGSKLPFIAVPTTSGTGSEATKNAVISRPGPGGFKKSLRHTHFMPEIAVVDPALTLTCPPALTAACGMDALTQLLESYVSVRASVMTDTLAASGLKNFVHALETAVEKDPQNLAARTRLSYGAYISGLTLANAGLGTVHGFASVIGGFSPMSHGNVCGTLLAETTKATIEALQAEDPAHPALEKYADAARLIGFSKPGCTPLIDGLFELTQKFRMPGLSTAGITDADIPSLTKGVGQKNNPKALSRNCLEKILLSRL